MVSDVNCIIRGFSIHAIGSMTIKGLLDWIALISFPGRCCYLMSRTGTKLLGWILAVHFTMRGLIMHFFLEVRG